MNSANQSTADFALEGEQPSAGVTSVGVGSSALLGSVVFVLPEPQMLNEAWGGMSAAMYRRAVAETPNWKIWLSFFLLIEHPYCKYARMNALPNTQDEQRLTTKAQPK